MKNPKNDPYYIKKALSEIEYLERYCSGLSYDELMSNDKTQDAIMFRLIQLIENIKKLSDEFGARHPEIKWGDIIGFRNGIVHEYGETDYTIVYQIVTKNIYELKEIFVSELNHW